MTIDLACCGGPRLGRQHGDESRALVHHVARQVEGRGAADEVLRSGGLTCLYPSSGESSRFCRGFSADPLIGHNHGATHPQNGVLSACVCWSPEVPVSSAPTTSARCWPAATTGSAAERRHGVRQADLRRQPGQPRTGRRRSALPVRPRRHRGRRRARRDPAGARRGGQLRRRDPCRPLDHRRCRLRRDQRAGHPDAARGLPAQQRPAGAPRVDRRGVRVDRRRLLDRGLAAAAQLPVQRSQSGRRPDRPLLRAHLRAQRHDHPLQQQLRPVPVPGEGRPALRHQPARRQERPVVRGRAQRPRLAARRRPLPRHPARAGQGRRRRDLQHRRRPRADQPRADRTPARRRWAPTGHSVTPVEDRKGHDRRYSVDDSKLRALGYAPQTSFEAGLAQTVAWYRDNRQWWEPLKSQGCTAHDAVAGDGRRRTARLRPGLGADRLRRRGGRA